MKSLFFDNLLAWSAQVSILAIAAAAASCVLRHPRARLYFWQSILAIILLLPMIAPWNHPVTVALPSSASVTLPAESVMIPVHASMNWGIDQLLALLAAGAVLRLVWVAVGLLRLARIRNRAELLRQPPVPFGGNACWYISDQVRGPVTFGWLRPSILLPTRMSELAPSAQEAIACHELLHVHRRDWLFVMAEELIRSVLWFHPAVWFVLSRVQLAREQVVDQGVVQATRDRAGYLDALLSVAAQRLQPDVAPAPLFLKKRQLAVRVQALLKDSATSASRLVANVSVAASVAILGAFIAVWFFPLRSAAQVLPDDPGITVDAGAVLAHRTPVRRPRGTDAVGDVLVELTLNPKGEVADARVLSGPEDLRKPALASVIEWHYLADTAPPSLVHATLHFGQGLAVVAASTPLPPPPPPPFPQPPQIAVVQRIQYEGLSAELQQRVQSTVRVGDTIASGDLSRVREELQQIDEHLHAGMTIRGPFDPQRAEVLLRIFLEPEGGQGPPPPPPPPPPPIAPVVPLPGTYKIGGGVSAPVPVLRPEPDYSEEARQAKQEGAELLQVAIDENGVPQEIKVIRSLGFGLDQKAIEAVQKWRFKPALKDGQPVPVTANIEINFRLL